MVARVTLALLVATAPCAAVAQGLDLSGGPSHTFVSPRRTFAVELPAGWNIAASGKDPGTFELRPADGTDASISIRRIGVPLGASPRQLLLNALEQRLRKLPAFREGSRRDVKVAGNPASVVDGRYDFGGNAQFPRAVEELFVVRDDEAFLFHFDAFAPAADGLAPALELVYRSFVIRPSSRVRPGTPGKASPELGIDTDDIPF